jgi:hypothetical protein
MNEFQNAYEVSKLTFTGHILPKIPDGLFAVVLESQAHCGFTDAVLPFPHRSLQRLCGSRRVADYYARKIVEANTDEDGCCEVWAEVYPKVPKKVPLSRYFDTDIPF